MTTDKKMRALMLSFPTLESVDFEGWDPSKLDRWAHGPAGTSGSQHAARFVLAVWSGQAVWSGSTRGGCPWDGGQFDVMTALKVWDDEHRAAFLAWARSPWWV